MGYLSVYPTIPKTLKTVFDEFRRRHAAAVATKYALTDEEVIMAFHRGGKRVKTHYLYFGELAESMLREISSIIEFKLK